MDSRENAESAEYANESGAESETACCHSAQILGVCPIFQEVDQRPNFLPIAKVYVMERIQGRRLCGACLMIEEPKHVVTFILLIYIIGGDCGVSCDSLYHFQEFWDELRQLHIALCTRERKRT